MKVEVSPPQPVRPNLLLSSDAHNKIPNLPTPAPPILQVHLDKILSINSPSFFRQVPRSMYFASTSPSYTTSESAAARTLVEVGSPKRDPISGVRGRGGSIVSSTTTAIMSPIGPTSTSTTPFLSPICGVRGELKKTGGEEAEERASFPSSPVAGQGIGAIERGVWGADWKMGIFGRREEEEEEEVGGGLWKSWSMTTIRR